MRQTLTARRQISLRPGLAAAAGFLCLALLAVLLEWRLWLSNAGMPLLSWEAAERLLMSLRWSEHPFLWNDRGWLPLSFAVHGTLLRLLERPLLAPVLLSTVLNLAGLWVYWRVVSRFDAGGLRGLAPVALCGLSRLSIENGLCAGSDPLFILCVFAGIHGFLRWEETGRLRHQAACAAAVAAACCTRYEGWVLALCVIGLGWSRPRGAWNLLVLLPPLAWMWGYWAAPSHDPLAFVPSLGRYGHPMTHGLNGGNLEKFLSAALLGSPVDFSRQIPAALPLVGLAVFCGGLLLGQEGRAGPTYLVLAGIPAAAMAYLAVVHHYPVDAAHMVVFHMLVMACLARPLGRLGRAVGMPAAALALTAAQSVGLDQQREELRPAVSQTRFVRHVAQFALRNLPADEALLIEIRTLCPHGEACDNAMRLRALAYPRRVRTDREDLSYRFRPEGRVLPEQASLFDLPSRELEERLRELRVRLIVARTPAAAARLRPAWETAGVWGPYRVLLRRGDRLRPGCAALIQTLERAFADEAARVR